MNIRIGQGVDVHQLAADCPLIIGGVKIPYEMGSKGHSDGDVLYHAAVDALLGAVASGDIGSHFPSSDTRWQGADSRIFLDHAWQLVRGRGYRLVNLDATVILQKPRLADFIPKMRRNLAEILDADLDQISVKATTTDYLGFSGRKEGLAAQAVVLLTQ